MSTLNFPLDPTVGQEYTFKTRTWEWDGEKWLLKNSGIKGADGDAKGSVSIYPSIN